MPTVPLFGIGTQGKSANVSAQRRINLYVESYGGGADDKAPLVLYSRPGLSPRLFTEGGRVPPYPVRGMISVNVVIDPGQATQHATDFLLMAQGGYEVHATSLDEAVSYGYANPPSPNTPALVTDSGPVVFADNGVEVVCVDGRSAYYGQYASAGIPTNLIDMATDLVPVADFPYGARTICSLAGRFIAENPSYPGRFYWSGLLDYSAWDPLDYATAETVPDVLSGVYAFRGELLLFGSKSLEFWAPTGGTDVFARVGGTAAPWGLVTYQSIQPVDDTLFFAGRRGGEIEVCALSGYNVSIVSTPDVEYDINRTPTGLTALTLRSGGHSFYVLNTNDKTWAYNTSSGEWSEWQTDGGRFAGQYAAMFNGVQVVSDYRSKNCYGLDPDAYDDNGEPMLREVQTRHLSADLDRLTLWEVALDVETGVGLSEGQGSDPQVMLQVSRDGGHTFGVELWQSLGALGQYAKRVIWRRLGRARDLVLRFRVTDAVKVVILGASIRVEK
jgi:hypothetical protein